MKPYKENKSVLQDFLERKGLAPLPKEARGKKAKVAVNKYYTMLLELSQNGTEEDLARLEAAGWRPELTPNVYWNKTMWQKVQQWKGTDGTVDGTFWFFSFQARRPEGYYVAGVRYNSKQEFLLSRTGLGKELF